MEKRITITIADENGNNKQISAFSNKQIQWLSDTKQWEYVLDKIIKSFDEGFETIHQATFRRAGLQLSRT